MTISVVAHPGSRKPRVERNADGSYEAYVREKAHGGEANEAVIRALAEVLGRPKSVLSILRGHAVKHKVIEIG